MSEQFSISDLASEFDVTTRTIRFYEEKGMLSPDRKGQNRIYNNADRTRLKLILRGKRLGLTLQESNEIISMYQPGKNNSQQLQTMIDTIRDKKEQLIQQQRDLELMILELKEAEDRCVTALNEVPKP